MRKGVKPLLFLYMISVEERSYRNGLMNVLLYLMEGT